MDEDAAPIGVRLREARMRQGLDLADCAAATRIRERYLIAIEDGRFESLPDPAYVSGFVRAYAAHLGVTMEGPERELPVPGATAPSTQKPRPVHLSATRITPRGVGQRPRWRGPALVVVVIVVLVLLVALAIGILDMPF